MPRPTPRQWIYLSIVGLAIVAVLFYLLTRDAQSGEQEAQAEQRKTEIVASSALDQVLAECEGPDLSAREQRFCLRAERAAEAVENDDLTLIPGPRGERGPVGPPGADGRDGEPGATGPRGATGPAGKAGEPGLPGPTGPAGDRGLTGTPGADGRDGQDGAQGPQGEPGPAGDQGPRGEQGPQGAPGAAGPAGPPGNTGPAGPAGPAGPQGIPGVINVATSPACGDLMPNMTVSLSYDAATQTLTLVCA